MKKIYLLSAMLLTGLLANKAEAQICVHIGFNIPARRVYVPAPQPVYQDVYNDDFDDSDDYYYLPEVEAYYSIPLNCYFYNDGSRWIRAAYLPGAYRNYDWRSARRFEVRGRRPYMNHEVYRGRWGGSPNRGDWNRRGDVYANRGNNGRNNNNGSWGRDNNRDRYNQPSRGNNGYNQGGGRGNWGGGQPQQPDRNQGGGRGNWGGGQPRQQQPQQPDRNQGGGRGNWGGGQSQQQPKQPDRNQGGGRGNWGGGQNGGGQQQQPAQPTNGGGNQNGGGRGDRGGYSGGGQVAQNSGQGNNARRMGVMRPTRF